MEYQENIKAAAKRMCEQLESKGVSVKHTQMLEAIATGFGLDSWRELKAVIDAPRAPQKPKCPPLGEMQEWTVDALYLEDNQQYGDRTTARVPLEAAYNVIVERRTDFGLELGILDVSNMAGETLLSPSYASEVEGRLVRETFVKLFEAASKLPAPTDDEKLALAWLDKVLKTYEKERSLEDLMDYSKLEDLSGYGKSHTPAPIVEGGTLLPSQALNLLCAAVESHIGLLTLVDTDDELAGCIFQIEAMCGYFEEVLDDKDVSLIVHEALDW
jgi:hypothetical protein